MSAPTSSAAKPVTRNARVTRFSGCASAARTRPTATVPVVIERLRSSASLIHPDRAAQAEDLFGRLRLAAERPDVLRLVGRPFYLTLVLPGGENVVEDRGDLLVGQLAPGRHDPVVGDALHVDRSHESVKQHVHQVLAAAVEHVDVRGVTGERREHGGQSLPRGLVASDAVRVVDLRAEREAHTRGLLAFRGWRRCLLLLQGCVLLCREDLNGADHVLVADPAVLVAADAVLAGLVEGVAPR